ncbi:zinc finger protein 665-like isoform X6 [Achroia grisella]|uniref:zinc finger protein 665-like isoform X6 n=1 Tax=Achroia grisella TaxID=688607 RepID=UPI0027D2927C|nr:zinc finger protein 665-like isoform X6 [Achroia grisella]
MDTTMNHGMCRCCASEGTFKNLSNAYQWMGQEEIYSDMLKECFDISLTTAEPGEEGGICEVCITQLRNAANFKKQVQHTEVQFKKCLQDKLFKSDLIKVEATNLDDGDDSDNDNNLSDNFSGNEFDMAIKKEKEDPKPKKRVATRASTSRAKKSKVDDGEPSTKRSRSTNNSKSGISGGMNKRVDVSALNDTNLKGKIIRKRNKEEIAKHISNMSVILQNSNATPIRSHDGIGYGCCYCNYLFIVPADLKNHTIDIHSDVEKTSFITRRCLVAYYVKLDITDLQCNLCNLYLYSYEDLMDHLHSKHDKKVHYDIKNQILPFKFKGESIRCHVCLDVFTNFKGLLEHMHSHYKNFGCTDCERGFVTEMALRLHSSIHKTGVFKCSFCPKIYNTLQKRKAHESYHEKQSTGRNKCAICNTKFSGYLQKQRHLAEVHDIQPLKFECQICQKVFFGRRTLNDHTKRHHLKERPNPCTYCDMKFYMKSELAEHMLKHTGVKKFECDFCSKLFVRKKNLQTHLRIHDNDRRHKCDMCEQTFVQISALQWHMKTRHSAFIAIVP